MAGHLLYDYLNKLHISNYEIIGLSKNEISGYTDIKCDVTNLEELKSKLEIAKPNVVVNCIGALISSSKVNPSNAVLLNAHLPLLLSEYSNELNYKLIHLSTDCVFSGLKGNYQEDESHDAIDLYGRSKSIGEMIDINSNCVLRTSIIGPEIRNSNEGLFDWFMKQRGTVKGYKQAFWSGITTLELTKCIIKVVNKNISGIYHVTNGVPISKFDLLSKIKKEFNLNYIELIEDNNYNINKSIAKSKKYDFKVSSYDRQVEDLNNYMLTNKLGKYDRYF